MVLRYQIKCYALYYRINSLFKRSDIHYTLHKCVDSEIYKPKIIMVLPNVYIKCNAIPIITDKNFYRKKRLSRLRCLHLRN